jgi:hypothetical protein
MEWTNDGVYEDEGPDEFFDDIDERDVGTY